MISAAPGYAGWLTWVSSYAMLLILPFSMITRKITLVTFGLISAAILKERDVLFTKEIRSTFECYQHKSSTKRIVDNHIIFTGS
jgi:hypothetical protein